MPHAPGAHSNVFADAVLAARLLACDPTGFGGIVLRGDGPARDVIVAELKTLLPTRRLPANIDDEALIGGRDLAATLAGQGGVRKGLLAEIDGGLLIVPMAERMTDAVAARLAGVLDTGEVVVERDGIGTRHVARFGLVLLDDGTGDEHVSDRLAERCAFRLDLSDVAPATTSAAGVVAGGQGTSRDVARRSDSLGPLASIALALGIDSARAPLFALRVVGMLAEDDALETAARLVLAHRATRLPPLPDDQPPPPPEDSGEPQPQDSATLNDIVLAAVAAALPPDVLAAIAAGAGRRQSSGSGGGERRKSPTRGRPLGARPGLPRGGARLALIDTLRAAAPWQKIRGRHDFSEKTHRIVIRREDVRIKRFETRADATTIFAVDASGSAAASRLAEAKGAVELLLAEAYVKRTEVALIAFRGSGAEVLLPPTRSLTRARRSLGDLPGGGGTPLAAGIDAAGSLAVAVKAKGRTPFVVLLSDGRGNIASDGNAGGAAMPDAEAAARRFGASGAKSVFIDISARPRGEAGALAALMGARYLPLPRADAAALHAAIIAP